MNSIQTIGTFCIVAAVVLLGFAVLNASQVPPAVAAAWIEGLIGVAVLVVGVRLRRAGKTVGSRR